jgi:hypothetical protein
MAAMAGASGAKSWLQAQHQSWLTDRRIQAPIEHTQDR